MFFMTGILQFNGCWLDNSWQQLENQLLKAVLSLAGRLDKVSLQPEMISSCWLHSS
jgi:hypothetical protein